MPGGSPPAAQVTTEAFVGWANATVGETTTAGIPTLDVCLEIAAMLKVLTSANFAGVVLVVVVDEEPVGEILARPAAVMTMRMPSP